MMLVIMTNRVLLKTLGHLQEIALNIFSIHLVKLAKKTSALNSIKAVPFLQFLLLKLRHLCLNENRSMTETIIKGIITELKKENKTDVIAVPTLSGYKMIKTKPLL